MQNSVKYSGMAVVLALAMTISLPNSAFAYEPGEVICQTGAANPGDGDWGIACVESGSVFGRVRVETYDEAHKFEVEVPEWSVCTEDSVLECEVFSPELGTRWFRAGSYSYWDEGWFPMFLLKCYCTSE